MLTKKDSLKNEVKTSKSQKTTNSSQSTEKQELAQNQPRALDKPYAPPPSKPQPTEKKPTQKTKVVIKYNVGYGNQLYIRGHGANLNWDKGTPLSNIKADEWLWETDLSFSHCEFKVLINDKNYENGENHYLNHGASVAYAPHFHHKS